MDWFKKWEVSFSVFLCDSMNTGLMRLLLMLSRLLVSSAHHASSMYPLRTANMLMRYFLHFVLFLAPAAPTTFMDKVGAAFGNHTPG
jgi:hypothetical protein